MPRFERALLSFFSLIFGITCVVSSTWQLPLYTNIAQQQQEMTANKRFFYQNAQVPWAGIYFFGGDILIVYGLVCLWLCMKPATVKTAPEPEADEQVQQEPPQPRSRRTPDPEPMQRREPPVAKQAARRSSLHVAAHEHHHEHPVRTLERTPVSPFSPPAEDMTPPAVVPSGGRDDRMGKRPDPDPIVPIAIRPTTNISGLSLPDVVEDRHDDIELMEKALTLEAPIREVDHDLAEVLPDEALLSEDEPEPEPFVSRAELELMNAQTSVEADFRHEPDCAEDFATKFEDPHIARKIAKCNMSLILSAQTRAGKTSFWKTVMINITRIFGYVDWHIVDQKNRTWLGLELKPGVVVVPSAETKYIAFAKKVAIVHNILAGRRDLSPSEVKEIYPVFLVLDDYHSLISLASNYLEPLRYKKMLASLNYIVTMGAYFKVFAVFLTQSHGIDSLKWADKNTRTSLIFMSLGRVSMDEDGDQQGSYASVSQAIGDANIIPAALTRNRLALEYAQLQTVAEQNNRSLGFTNLGRERLLLMPYFDEEALDPLYVISAEPELDDLVLEAEEPAPLELTNTTVSPVETSPSPEAIEPLEEHFLAIIQLSERFKSKSDGWITARDFRINAPSHLRNRYSADELRFFFVELAKSIGRTSGEGISLRYQA